MQITLPPYARCVVRATGPFSVYHGDAIIGPDHEFDRVINLETGHDPMDITIEAGKDVDITHQVELRPSRYEQNSGIPHTLQEPIFEPTIQEMMRMYLAEYVGRDDPNEIETPDEFFDFGDDPDDEQDLLTSPWELTAEEMEEQYVPETPPESTGDDSAESATPEPTAEETSQKETQNA